MMHGEIKVNGAEIGRWSARRKQHPPQAVNDYEVGVVYFEPDGTSHSKFGVIRHNYGDGALTLMAEIMAWAAPLLPPQA